MGLPSLSMFKKTPDNFRYRAFCSLIQPFNHHRNSPPPPMHSVASPSVLSRACMACNSVTRIRAPLAPIGCPSAMAPPLTFTFSGSKPKVFPTARNCAANASLASMRSMSASCSPASCNAFAWQVLAPYPSMREARHRWHNF